MAENLQQKQHAKTQVDRQLARLEEQIFTLEGQYLDETANTGNVVVVRPSARSDSCYLISLFHLCVSVSVCLPLCVWSLPPSPPSPAPSLLSSPVLQASIFLRPASLVWCAPAWDPMASGSQRMAHERRASKIT